MPDVVVTKRASPLNELKPMSYGSMSNDDGIFDVSSDEYHQLISSNIKNKEIIRTTVGGAEFIRGIVRRSIYISDPKILSSEQEDAFKKRFEAVRSYRLASNRAATRKLADKPMLFAERRHEGTSKVFVPQVLSERREYVTCGLLDKEVLVIAPHMQIIGGGLLEMAILSSKMHHVWISRNV